MLIRISLIVAILAGLAAGVISFVTLKKNIDATIVERNEWHTKQVTEQKAKVVALKDASDTHAKLDTTTKELATTKEERDGAVAKAAEQTKRADDIAGVLKKTEGELATTQNKLGRWEAIGIPVETAKATIDSINIIKAERDSVQTENKVLYGKYVQVQTKLDLINGKIKEVPLPEGLQGKVLAVDPKFDFVILDIGRDKGVLANGKLLVHHNGRLVAKVVITDDIMPDRCVANVEPGWKKGDITEGDQVFY
jgi:hypothetical protein